MALASAALACSPARGRTARGRGPGRRPGPATPAGRRPRPPRWVLRPARPRRRGGGRCAAAQDLPHPALADPDQAGDVGEFEPLAALGLPQLPELLDALGAGQGAAPQRGQGAAHIVLAHPDLSGDLGRVELLATGDLAGLVELLDALQRPPRRAAVLGLGSAAVGVGGLQGLQLLRGWPAVAGRLRPQAGQPPVALLAGAQGVQPLAGDGAGGADLGRQRRPHPAAGRRGVRGSGRRR